MIVRRTRTLVVLGLATALGAAGARGQAPGPDTTRAQDRPVAEMRVLRPGDSGQAVEDLQRRLNARLEPSPLLTVDGDYGPATRAAVERFQKLKGLEATGLADAATIEALGPVPASEAESVPPPSAVNAAPAEKQPPDPLDGPPFVTAKAWVVVDGATGDVLAGDHADEPRPMASTTKIMTALVVLRLAREDAGVLDEVVTFSERADGTVGSTSGLRAGEKVSVRELLYGLLLPSGNDASVALGEHFGGRFGDEEDGDDLARFVAEMNRVAAELGLKATRFANTHGLPSDQHFSSARDLAKLASVALADPTFAKVVSTSRRGATVEGPDGASRNVIWTNTNNLLGIEGYDGVKTGTTNAAGACLVASGRREGRHLIVVVLGSESSDGRYVDARNLFRWAWGK
jgi:D-alanyl-D-alanine carboxypeptidase (penicillin-binding protein 5/6)